MKRTYLNLFSKAIKGNDFTAELKLEHEGVGTISFLQYCLCMTVTLEWQMADGMAAKR